MSYKPDIRGANQPGIDLVTIKEGIVYVVDNKALSRNGSIGSVSALTSNFRNNIGKVLAEFQQQLARNDISHAERQLIEQARSAIIAKRYQRIVTNANLNSRAATSGITQRLADQGILFIDLMR